MEDYSDFTQQKVCLLGTARIVRLVLESCEVIGHDLFPSQQPPFWSKRQDKSEITPLRRVVKTCSITILVKITY